MEAQFTTSLAKSFLKEKLKIILQKKGKMLTFFKFFFSFFLSVMNVVNTLLGFDDFLGKVLKFVTLKFDFSRLDS